MSTRSVIARRTGPNTFVGVYHHWDGYPTALGATLFGLRNSFFSGDTEKMLEKLIDEHPAGWSTINDKDMSKPAGFHELGEGVPCEICGKNENDHYCQYYKDHPLPKRCGGDWGDHLGHTFKPNAIEQAEYESIPECYCHGGRSGDANPLDEKNSPGGGCEFAYVFEGDHMLVMSARHADGTASIGMFGSGDPDAEWRQDADIDLNGPEPDWKEIEKAS